MQRAIYPRSNEVVVFENVEQGRTVTDTQADRRTTEAWLRRSWWAALRAAADQPLHASTISFSDLLITTNTPRFINFISLDVEGQELPALQTFPFDRHEVGIWIVEHNHDTRQRAKIANLLQVRQLR